MIKGIFENKLGKLEKIIGIVLLTLLIPLIVLGSIIADSLIEELTEEESTEEELTEENEEIIDDKKVEEIISEKPLEEIEIIEENETIVGIPEVTEVNETSNLVEENKTLEPPVVPGYKNEILNNSPPNSDPEPRPEIELKPWSEPEINIQISHPTNITRGEVIEVKAVITNLGTSIKDVLGKWNLSPDFNIISGNKIEGCGDLNSGESCIAIINVQTSHSTLLGENQLKIMVSYKNGI